ncbi:GntR family transcriptional regulator [Enterococcus faecalis]|uniref:GntR family transcriptional regulator n=1 Tax=Enterococcus faecalis TaxID=1351 RepID=UPI0021E7A4C2|nr:GntR family transcriptional regulator [Enterococcus faecalis]MCV3151116.1 GntR family transcriptional regulator [Enterococcus faecalis]MCV3172552.1 GntR family transcriptional regulator [Enterococcus faecalis]
MEILISYQSKDPIYIQIVSQIKKLVLDGKLKPGDSIPAMRSLAKDLNVSVITVQKAYEILRDEGFLNTVVGKGTFVVMPEMHDLKINQKANLITKIEETIKFAYINGFNSDEFLDLVNLQVKLFDDTIKEK